MNNTNQTLETILSLPDEGELTNRQKILWSVQNNEMKNMNKRISVLEDKVSDGFSSINAKVDAIDHKIDLLFQKQKKDAEDSARFRFIKEIIDNKIVRIVAFLVGIIAFGEIRHRVK